MILAIHGMLGNSTNRYANFINGAGNVYARYPSITPVSTFAIWTRIRVTNPASPGVPFCMGTIQLGTGYGIALFTRSGGGGNFLQVVANNNTGSNLYFPSGYTVVANTWIDCIIFYKSSQFHLIVDGVTYSPAGTVSLPSFNPYFTVGAVTDNSGANSSYIIGHMDFLRYYTDPTMTLATVQAYLASNIDNAERRYEFSNNTNDSSPNGFNAIYEQNFLYGDVV